MPDMFLQGLEDRRLKREAERMAMNKRMAQLNVDGEADAIAKRVYLDMVKGGDIPAVQAEPKAPTPDAIESAPAAPDTAPRRNDGYMVKDMVLAVLRDAFPAGLNASEIKHRAYNRFKQHINPNTLTVTLGRYSKPKDGDPVIARCVGRVWFYVPPINVVRSPELALVNGGKHAAE
jgi:hypothetical protein